MISTEAVVIRVEGQRVWVETSIGHSCQGCDQHCPGGIGRRHSNGPLEVLPDPSVQVEPGDQVTVTIDDRTCLRMSCLVYLLPLTGLLTGALVAPEIVLRSALTSDVIAWLGGILGLGVTLAMMRRLREAIDNGIRPRILQKL